MLAPNPDESLLLHLNEAIATIRDKETLFRVITNKLRLIFPFDLIGINVFDKELVNKRLFLRSYVGGPAESLPVDASSTVFSPIAGSPVEQLVADPHLRHITLQEYAAEYPDFEPFNKLRREGINYMTTVPLRLGGRLTGFLILAAARRPALSAADEHLLLSIGSLVAVAVGNTLAFEDIARREGERTMQLAITNALLSIKQREPLFRAVAESLGQVVPFDYFGIRVLRTGPAKDFEAFAEFSRVGTGDFVALALDRPPVEGDAGIYLQLSSLLQAPGVYAGAEFHALAVRYPRLRYVYDHYGTRALLVAPIWQRPDSQAVLTLAATNPEAFTADNQSVIQSLVPQIALVLENLFAFEQIEELKAQVEQERTYLIDEINTDRPADGLIGTSPALQQVRQRIAQVAGTDATVLITGETGTGKEVVARALHQASPRLGRALVKINCAALPAQLIESELFGHEKGAYTGAVERRIGKFELANGGTIFLDEVGELPLDLQAKLLRVLQEKEFERLGSNRVLQTDARVLAATNRVLEEEVRAGRFRADLYYRLNVFPIHLAPLRERPQDIAPLVQHYLATLSKRLARPPRAIRPADLAALQAYAWPGNIRQLEHVLEQAIIVSQGPWLEFGGFAAAPTLLALPPTAALLPSETAPTAATNATNAPLKTLREQERDHILLALHRTEGRVSGPSGAALLLDINPKTLEARMKKLGIRRTVVAG
ncbi:sigma-54-dependent Fis family transcriptional regulator [Hymenobacter sp. H14-R3]|uniref:sigma-54-dependent Fis family transcriptional regulator n=1 Tax=Hymenobacter sp. H14-R3 TaxID=3046308 RepID=UPI0024BB61EE|nr:sigma-54-dependent Fis family transcriptional regulator [Hymenobacter sp. H14-R3]MDJ0363891.1 sigma-54-dependent Fis family transcriptional regulator [Hymenobacter sp. H14-R3]